MKKEPADSDDEPLVLQDPGSSFLQSMSLEVILAPGVVCERLLVQLLHASSRRRAEAGAERSSASWKEVDS